MEWSLHVKIAQILFWYEKIFPQKVCLDLWLKSVNQATGRQEHGMV
jgi:hypothetical protein